MCRVSVLIVCALLASCGAVCGHEAAQPAISIQSPRDGASVLLGEPVVIELEFSPAAALSAAGNYAYPDFNVDWPYGRNRSPNPGGFVTAATLPVVVFVGSLDLDTQTTGGAFQRGENRIERAQNWTAAMQQLAWENGLEPRVQYTLLPGIPHSSKRTGPACAEWLLGVLESGVM